MKSAHPAQEMIKSEDVAFFPMDKTKEFLQQVDDNECVLLNCNTVHKTVWLTAKSKPTLSLCAKPNSTRWFSLFMKPSDDATKVSESLGLAVDIKKLVNLYAGAKCLAVRINLIEITIHCSWRDL